MPAPTPERLRMQEAVRKAYAVRAGQQAPDRQLVDDLLSTIEWFQGTMSVVSERLREAEVAQERMLSLVDRMRRADGNAEPPDDGVQHIPLPSGMVVQHRPQRPAQDKRNAPQDVGWIVVSVMTILILLTYYLSQ